MAYETNNNTGPASTVSIHPQNVLTNQAKRLLGVLQGVSPNAVGSYPMQVINTAKYLFTDVNVTNLNNGGANVVPTGLVLNVSTTQGGASAFAAIAATNLTTPLGIVTGQANAQTTLVTGQQLWVNVTTPLTTPSIGATVDVYVYGVDFNA
jgi:hypothetical protein